ncbi:MAG: penicillin acylase family protein [Gammaproteobacteria bacterium]|jgi:penicillin amidase
MRRLLRIAIISALTIIGLCLLAGWLGLRASLPRRDGSAEIPGLAAVVRLEFDALGIARIHAASQLDAIAAQGFVHAQDRFFQMDLTRRSAAGELAAVFGPAAVDFDSQRRIQQLRRRARAMLAEVPQRHRRLLEAYTAGVNAGLADLGAWPPEYLLLRQAPARWLPEDSLLVVYALYTMLSNNDAYERHNGALRELLPASVFEFLTPLSARDDRPLTARNDADLSGGYEPAEIPGPAVIDLRTTRYDAALNIVRQPLTPSGSNNWAIVGGRLGERAILANDPHLSMRVPNIFHRAELGWGTQILRGVGIPGLPGIMIGANDAVAWGATVSYADQADYVVIDRDPANPDRYLVPTGAEAFTLERELIDVAGRDAPIEIEVRSSRWGPIVAQDHAGRPLALRATWLDPDGLDLSLLDISDVTGTEQAMNLLRAWHGPSLNWVAADRDGTIGWTINGPVPLRRNYDGSVPEHWGTGEFGWRGNAELPGTVARGADWVYSANNRQLTMPYARTLSRLSLPPYRARSIAEALRDARVADEADSLALQLDTRVAAYDLLRDLILACVPVDTTDATLARARALVTDWDGHARVDSRAMPILDRFYDRLLERVLGPVFVDIRAVDTEFVYRWPLADEVLRRLLEVRPANFLPAEYVDWDAWLRDILRASIATTGPGADAPRWGEVNRLDVSHPLGGVALLRGLLEWPSPALPGHTFSLRVAQPGFGAVIRMNVAPASPETGILQFAGGQSGHFLSPHYDDQIAAWAAGTPTPFLAGPMQYSYMLYPAR